jgi:hypothetical protein
MDQKQAKAILAQRSKFKPKFDPELLFNASFPQQNAFIKDPDKLKALFCTRRGAKSFTDGLYMVYEALTNPNCNCLFIGLTRLSARDIVWKDILKVINRKYKLGAKFNGTDLTMTFPNGSVISVTGVDADEDEMNKLLGRKYRLVCIDEASLYTIDVRHLVYDILGPAMADLEGTIVLSGTASNYTRGLFFDITNGVEAGWKLYEWSAFDNPFVNKQWSKQLDIIKQKRPLYMETPQFRQWYLNEWVVDTDKLVYKYDQTRNSYKHLPNLSRDGWTYILGVDTGWEDDTAFVLGGYHINDPTLYVIKSFAKKHMYFDHEDPSQSVVKTIQAFMNHPDYAPCKVIIDGANKQGVESMRVRSNIPFEYADKVGKVDFIELLNADLIQGKIKICDKETDLIDEMMALVWVTKGDKIVFPKKEHPALPNHRNDAMLYMWRNGYHYQSSPAEQKIVKYSKQWYEKQSENVWEREREALIKQNQSYWPEDGEFGRF